MRLLPKGQDWTPYAWLIYLVYFAAIPFVAPMNMWQRAATAAGTVVGLPLYFWGYWVRGRRILIVVGLFVLLGVLLMPLNPGASVFFVYGVSYLGKTFEPAVAYRYLGATIGIILLQAWLIQLPAYAWVPSVVFTALIGAVVAQQFQRKRLMERLLLAQGEAERMAQIAERERIARDLHDLLGHTLSVIVLKSELASRLTATDPARAAEEIREVEIISRNALAEVRSAVRGYRSRGFDSELTQARRALETAGIQVEASIDTDGLSPAQEGVLAMALREAVTNVVRHAHARTCRLQLARRNGYCQLEVADDGRGGDLVEGNGLRGMRERVEALGGVLERDCSHGTLLRIRVPA